MSPEYWYLLLILTAIAATAMATRVGGATFFSTLFILALRLPPKVALGTALITEIFGFSSGVNAHVRKRLIDYKYTLVLLIITIPMTLVGTWISTGEALF